MSAATRRQGDKATRCHPLLSTSQPPQPRRSVVTTTEVAARGARWFLAGAVCRRESHPTRGRVFPTRCHPLFSTSQPPQPRRSVVTTTEVAARGARWFLAGAVCRRESHPTRGRVFPTRCHPLLSTSQPPQPRRSVVTTTEVVARGARWFLAGAVCRRESHPTRGRVLPPPPQLPAKPPFAGHGGAGPAEAELGRFIRSVPGGRSPVPRTPKPLKTWRRPRPDEGNCRQGADKVPTRCHPLRSLHSPDGIPSQPPRWQPAGRDGFSPAQSAAEKAIRLAGVCSRHGPNYLPTRSCRQGAVKVPEPYRQGDKVPPTLRPQLCDTRIKRRACPQP